MEDLEFEELSWSSRESTQYIDDDEEDGDYFLNDEVVEVMAQPSSGNNNNTRDNNRNPHGFATLLNPFPIELNNRFGGRSNSPRVAGPLPPPRSPLPLPRDPPHYNHNNRVLRPRRPSANRSTGSAMPPSRSVGRQPEVIDLTESSPIAAENARYSAGPYNNGARNPRRTNSQRISPPSLSRSDGTLVEPAAEIIDLTVDNSPVQTRPPHIVLPRPHSYYQSHLPMNPHSQQPRQGSRGPFPTNERMRHPRVQRNRHVVRTESDGESLVGISVNVQNFFMSMVHHRLGDGVPEGEGLVRVPYNYEPPPNARPPIPNMEPIKPAVDGFTRDTVAEPTGEEEQIVVCAACEEELAYDPSNVAATGNNGGAKKRSKKASNEHHFWALKNCGHVYCAECVDNRRPSKAFPDGVGFKINGSHPTIDITCAVDGCHSKAGNKSEWVGIYH